MSQSKSKFIVLPNEVIYHIFDYLTAVDIIRSFASLQVRYDDLIRFYIKRIDLTNDWKGNRQELKWISEKIEILKVDRYHMHLLTDHRFGQLNSLHLVNIFRWNEIISNMNVKSVSLWFDDNNHSSPDQGPIPRRIIRFYSNIIHNPNSFHDNLIEMNICVGSMFDLIEIIERIPNIEHLSVTFVNHFDNTDNVKKTSHSIRFDSMKLIKLNEICFITKNIKNTETNEDFPFNQIEIFLERCCPNETILKRITMKFDRIKYSKEIWLTLNRYKNTFYLFNFYGSFIVDEEGFNNMKVTSDNDKFDYHIEGNISSHPDDCYIHIYSLPFTFNRLYGFSLCDELGRKTSYNSVRHLYFTETRSNDRCISFRYLLDRMPHLISINCIAPFNHNNTNIPILMPDQGIFHHVNYLRFKSYCCDKYCICRNVLPRLIDRMPHLRSLSTSDDAFLRTNHPLPPITRLDWSEWGFKSFDILIKRVPHVSMLTLGDIKPYIGELSPILTFLFVGLPSLKFLSFQFDTNCSNDRTPYRKIIQQSLVTAQNMNNRLHRLRLDLECQGVKFYLEN